MLPILGIFEIAVRVKDLSRAEAFYTEVLGLEQGIRDEQRKRLFLHVGGNTGMVVLQEDKGEWPLQHFAFSVSITDLNRASALLREKGVRVSEPVQHGWMGGTSVYFEDPDGHDLELFAQAVAS